jgi:hypothetical protein
MRDPSLSTKRRTILVGRGELRDTLRLTSVLCHEIAHDWLALQVKLARDPLDHEGLTDLATVYLGFGCFRVAEKGGFHQKRVAGGRHLQYLASEELLLALALWLSGSRCVARPNRRSTPG